MIIRFHQCNLRAAFVALLLSMRVLPAQAGEERTITAFAGWDAIGQAFEVSPGNAVFLGKFGGTLFVSDGQGNLNAGALVCPARLSIVMKSGDEIGEGNCIIAGRDGSKIYGAWTCKGVVQAGCKGQLQLSGGSGQFQNATGSGAFVIQSAMREVIATAMSGTSVEAANGILVLSDFHYKIP